MTSRFSKFPTSYAKRCILQEVCGQPLTFYPLSVEFLFALEGLAPPLAAAFSSFMDGGSERDQKTVQRTWGTKDAGEFGSHVETEPVSIEVSKARIEQREKGIRSLIQALLGKDTKALLGQVILDSLRDRSDEDLPTPSEGIEFVSHLDLETLREYVSAVLEANRGVFGPFLDRVGSFKKALASRIESALAPHGYPKSPDEDAGASTAGNPNAGLPSAELAQAST